MRKSLSIFLFVVFLCSQFGYFFMYALVRYQADESMETTLFNSIKDKECDVINYDNNQQNIYWEVAGETFLLGGKEYDIVKTKLVNCTTYLYCITENKECAMLSDMSLTYTVDHSNTIDVQSIYSLECIIDPVCEYLRSCPAPGEKFPNINSTFTAREKNIVLPPPRPFSV